MNHAFAALRRTLALLPEPTDVARFGRAHLLLALALVWIAGVGRHWDDERAGLLLRSGVFSIGYALALAAFLHLASLALRPRFPSYFHTLVGVGFTAPPAFLYALPVELWMEPEPALELNLLLLLVVACWRVLAWIAWLHRVQGLSLRLSLTSAALPLAAIVSTLALANLHHATIDTMSGIQSPRSPEHVSYEAIVVLSVIALLSSPVWLTVYAFDVARAQKAARTARIVENAVRLELLVAEVNDASAQRALVAELERCGARVLAGRIERKLFLELSPTTQRSELRQRLTALLRDRRIERLSSASERPAPRNPD